MNFKTSLGIISCFFISQLFCWGQLNTGDWNIGGSLSANRNIGPGPIETRITLKPELGYVFHNRWMFSGKMNITIVDDVFTIGHRLNVRYAFVRMNPIILYAGLDYEREEEKTKNNAGQTRRKFDVNIGPFAGYLHFFNRATALEFQIRYPIVHYYKNNSNFRTYSNNGYMNATLALQYFFGGVVSIDRNESIKAYPENKWMIGGFIELGGINTGFISKQEVTNNLAPSFGYFFSKKWMLGFRTYISNGPNLYNLRLGLSPFGRYYFLQKTKHSLYAEAGLMVQLLTTDPESIKDLKQSYRDASLGIGWSRWLAPKLCFNFLAGPRLFQFVDSPGNFSGVYDVQFYTSTGLECYF